MSRENKLNDLHLPSPITIGGKRLNAMSFGRRELLKTRLHNTLMLDDSDRDQTPEHAMAEMIYVMSLTIAECLSLKLDKRHHERIIDFMLLHERELQSVVDEVSRRIASNTLGAMEDMSEGKEVPARAFCRALDTLRRGIGWIMKPFCGAWKSGNSCNYSPLKNHTKAQL